MSCAVPVQPTWQEVVQRRSDWRGDLSSLSQPPPVGTRDCYSFPSSGRVSVLMRWHSAARVRLFSPQNTTLPITIRALTGRRRTVAQYMDGSFNIIDDRWSIVGTSRRFLEREWRRRTELEIDLQQLSANERMRAQQVAAQSLALLNR